MGEGLEKSGLCMDCVYLVLCGILDPPLCVGHRALGSKPDRFPLWTRIRRWGCTKSFSLGGGRAMSWLQRLRSMPCQRAL